MLLNEQIERDLVDRPKRRILCCKVLSGAFLAQQQFLES